MQARYALKARRNRIIVHQNLYWKHLFRPSRNAGIDMHTLKLASLMLIHDFKIDFHIISSEFTMAP